MGVVIILLTLIVVIGVVVVFFSRARTPHKRVGKGSEAVGPAPAPMAELPPTIEAPLVDNAEPSGSGTRTVKETPKVEPSGSDQKSVASVFAIAELPQNKSLGTVEIEGSPSVPVTGEPVEETPATELQEAGPARFEPKEPAPRDSQEGQKRKPPEPEKRGGRSRAAASAGGEQAKREGGIRYPKPEIVCWKREQEWILAVELPEGAQQAPHLTVLQNGDPLKEDESARGCWRLASLTGEISVQGTENAVPNVCLGNSGYQLFKLSGRELREGRRVKQAFQGSYLVVAARSWERDEQQAGPPPAAPEPVFLGDYRAHFFDLIGDQPLVIALRDSARHPVLLGSPIRQFQLVGQELRDATENQGPLLVSKAPRVRILSGSWHEIGTIVLGEEGQGRGKWRKHFAPATHSPDQEMPGDLVERRAGWYFIRFYDHQDELMDSLDFRFAAGLRGITIGHARPLPRKSGHDPTTVEFYHEPGWDVSPGSAQHIKIRPGSGRTVLHIPPVPDCDRSEWLVGPRKGPEIRVAVLVERVWWAVGSENDIPSRWQDKCLSVAREAFRATAESAVWFRLPRGRWVQRVFVGFRAESSRGYPLKVNESTLAIPLRDLCDSEELKNRVQDQFLRVWIEVNGSTYEAALLCIQGEGPCREQELNLGAISPSQLAHVLTLSRRLTRGPLRQLLKKVRGSYRRPRRLAGATNAEFVRRGLCALAVFHHLAPAGRLLMPTSARRWKGRAQLAGRQLPETMREVWSLYSKLGGLNRDPRK